jgi:hypothetical protein
MNPDLTAIIVVVIVVAMVLFNIISIIRNRSTDRAAAEALALAKRNTAALERIASALEKRDLA